MGYAVTASINTTAGLISQNARRRSDVSSSVAAAEGADERVREESTCGVVAVMG
jgi:hypothetical protein